MHLRATCLASFRRCVRKFNIVKLKRQGFINLEVTREMGGGFSSAKFNFEGKSKAEICKLVYPLYYTTDPVTDQDVALAKSIWSSILDDTATSFQNIAQSTSEENVPQYSSCMVMFYNLFYERLFDIHPVSFSAFYNFW